MTRRSDMSRFVKAAQILLATLREILDEAAYERFLRSSGMVSSPEAYRAFWREREVCHARRPKCC
jgi:hypothetical protein